MNESNAAIESGKPSLFTKNFLQQIGHPSCWVLAYFPFLFSEHEEEAIKGSICNVLVQIKTEGVGKWDTPHLGI